MTPTIHHGDCLDVLRAMPDNSVDSIVTDPPYGLSNTSPEKVTEAIVQWATGNREFVPDTKAGFMGAEWDAFVPPPAVWDECLRVLKPGGHLLAFAGTRTQDLMGISIRMAHFDVRENIAWMHGQGMPKAKGQLKPAFEPVIVARKPFKGSTKANVEAWGVGDLNIDATRIPGNIRSTTQGQSQNAGDIYGADQRHLREFNPHAGGRWPANVVLDGTTAPLLDEQTGIMKDGVAVNRNRTPGERRKNDIFGGSFENRTEDLSYGSGGGGSRFFYVAKAPKKERPVVDGVAHPTVKPLSLLEWLIKLSTPEGGTVLDPFAGSGTTGEAALLNGFHPILIEAHAPYIPLIEARLTRAGATK